MKDNTIMAIIATTLILTIGTCATMDTYMQYKTKPLVAQTVTNTVIESTTASTVALQLAVGHAEVLVGIVNSQKQIVDTLVLLKKRIDQVEASIHQPPKIVVEGYTNFLTGPSMVLTNDLHWYTNIFNETH